MQNNQFVVKHRAGTVNANADGLSWEPWFPTKGKGMSQIKENNGKKFKADSSSQASVDFPLPLSSQTGRTQKD